MDVVVALAGQLEAGFRGRVSGCVWSWAGIAAAPAIRKADPTMRGVRLDISTSGVLWCDSPRATAMIGVMSRGRWASPMGHRPRGRRQGAGRATRRRRKRRRRIARSSEEDLEPEPEQVGRAHQVAAGAGGNGTAEHRVLPVEVDLGVVVPVPVRADVDDVAAIGPLIRVGEAAGEDLIAEVEVAEAGVDLEGAEAELAVVVAEPFDGPDDVDATGELLAGEEIRRSGPSSP